MFALCGELGCCCVGSSICVAMYIVSAPCVLQVGIPMMCDAWWNASAVVSVSVTCRKWVYAWLNEVPCSLGSMS